MSERWETLKAAISGGNGNLRPTDIERLPGGLDNVYIVARFGRSRNMRKRCRSRVSSWGHSHDLEVYLLSKISDHDLRETFHLIESLQDRLTIAQRLGSEELFEELIKCVTDMDQAKSIVIASPNERVGCKALDLVDTQEDLVDIVLLARNSNLCKSALAK